MADQKRRAPLPPMYGVHGAQIGGHHAPVREISNPAYVEADGSQQGTKISLPLPDYETLFPQKRHGVQGHTRWDHIIAEVNQKHRESPPELLGPEMSVDGPEEHKPSPRSSISQGSPAMRHYQTQPQESKPLSSKKVAAPAPPKPVASPLPPSAMDSSQRQSQYAAHQSLMRPSPSPLSASVKTDTLSRGLSGPRKALLPSPAAASAPRPSSLMDLDTAPSDDQRNAQVAVNKEAPTAKPRQRAGGKEPTQQEESAVNSNTQILSSSSAGSMDKKDRQAMDNFAKFDPFPSTEFFSRDPWTQPKQNQKGDDLFTGNVQKEQKPEERGMSADDLDQIFNQDKPTDPFASFNGSNSNKHNDYGKKIEDSKQEGFAFLRKNSQRGKKTPPSPSPSDKKTVMSQQEPEHKEDTSLPAANESFSTRDVTNGSVTLQLQADEKAQRNFYKAEDPFGAQPFIPSVLTSSEPLPVVLEEPASQAGSLSGGKSLLRAWVSPSEAQPVSTQNSQNGVGLALTPRRPHPVKPMRERENLYPISTPAVKDIKVRDSTPGTIKVAESVESGPYTQLTQEELITLVVKQQTDLSRKDAKIVELEEYIDNLLVRVIDEQPSILQALNSPKPV